MQLTTDIAIIASGIMIFYQDMNDRLISVALILLLLCAIAIKYFMNNTTIENMDLIISNLLFIIAQVGILFFYFRFVKKTKERFFDGILGWGDIIMMLALCFVFPLKGLIMTLLLSYILTILFAFTTKLRSLPLAGWMSLSFISIYSLNMCMNEPIVELLF